MPVKKLFTFALAALISTLGLTAIPVAAAEKFPQKPIQVVIPFQPGDTDNMLRPFLEKMGEFLNQPAVLIYKSGAGGGVGAGFVAASKPDGYTLVGTTAGSIVVVPLANKDVRYTPASFKPIAALSEGGFMLVVPAKSPWLTLKDLVDDSKKRPSTLTFSTSGAMGITHLLAEAFSQEAGIAWNHIPFQGSGPAITALLGNHVDLSTTAIAPARPHMLAGTLRPLAVFGETRLKAYPAVPTLKELGYNIASPALYGISAPRDTPQAVVDAIYNAAKQVSEKYNTQITENLAVFGAEIKVLGPKEYSEYLEGQNQLFSRAVKNLNLNP